MRNSKKRILLAVAVVLLLGGAFFHNASKPGANNHGYVYTVQTSSVDGKSLQFWTLQIPDMIKFTFEKGNGEEIVRFVKSVDALNGTFGWTRKNRDEAEDAFYAIPTISIP